MGAEECSWDEQEISDGCPRVCAGTEWDELRLRETGQVTSGGRPEGRTGAEKETEPRKLEA